ncbi:hypothetical protein K504DRAFT_460952 [Pleomassaria siparia CBS 279.74]|uniref:Transcription elongation factor Eaf N-terminal domain-containing protein n=1 Tax=Pleomassaria siparia CBS 279.74 TaxID=1314801 RepID=A0A6G1JVQ0_9PLEO|nr:hypothetical protein K504DRAFT_460952 [Pleomassaria siparia CBS 279.74]
MASPMVEGRVDPHKKAHYSLHISDRIGRKESENDSGGYSGFKYNHKPAQTTSTRNTTLTSTSSHNYALKVEDSTGRSDGAKDIFRFTGQRSATSSKSSYVLIFDPTSQKATLEPLSASYTFNLASKNGVDIPTSTYPHIYPKKQKGEASQDTIGDEELFDLTSNDNENDEPDPDNPYDFRHFLGAVSEKKGNESEYMASSPDYRTGTGSAMNTPLLTAATTTRKPLPSASASIAARPKPKNKAAIPPKPRKRKESEEAVRKSTTTAKKQQSTPTVRLDRAATSSNPGKKASAKPTPTSSGSKIKSQEIITNSSDESDVDAEGSATSSPAHVPQHGTQIRSPSPPQESYLDSDADSDGGGGLEIEVPDARPPKPRTALASLGLGQNLGLGGLGLGRLQSPDPGRGPISLASAANSVEGSPAPSFGHNADADLDFGEIGGAVSDIEDEDGYAEEDEEEDEIEEKARRERDGDVPDMDIGPPATVQAVGSRPSVGGMAVEDEEDEDVLYKEMMEGFAGGDSSEESEEE